MEGTILTVSMLQSLHPQLLVHQKSGVTNIVGPLVGRSQQGFRDDDRRKALRLKKQPILAQ
jgi:hypothetical protein